LGVAPSHPLAGERESVVRVGGVDTDDDHSDTGAGELVGDVVRRAAGGGGALDLGGVAPNLLAPVVEDCGLVGQRVDVAEAVPGVGVLGGQAECLTLSAAADQDRDLAGWGAG
jgi:hypothetical protein